MKRIIKKQIFRIEFKLASPLAIGASESVNTDKDVMRNSKGVPYIPASALAGVCRAALDGKECNINIWGDVKTKGETDEVAIESSLIFSDANIIPEDVDKYYVSVRDGVALDEYKTAIAGAKFDMEVLEPGVRFVTYIEQTFTDENDEACACKIADLFASGNICFGGKTMRGYGAISDVKIHAGVVRFDGKVSTYDDIKSINLKDWISAGVDDIGKYLGEYNAKKSDEIISIRLGLKQVGGISIRKYTTDIYETSDISAPDQEQLTNHNGNPVVPGTSWAGAFEHQIKKLVGEYNIEDINGWKESFGYCINGKRAKSKVRFSESEIKGATEKIVSRTAIDRFTGGAADKALFTEKTYYNGETSLEISFAKGFKMDERLAKAFAAAITDLHLGIMAVGGETSIGRGMFKITSINGEDMTGKEPQEIYEIMVDRILEKGGIDR